MNFFPSSILIALTILGVSCTKLEQKPDPIRLGLNNWPAYEFFHVMDQLGFDKEAGIDIKVIQFSALSDVRRSFERRELDIIATTPVEVLLAKQNAQLDPVIFYVLDHSLGGDAIIARKNVPNIKSLKGKVVGVETGTMCIYELYRALQKNGLKLSDVKIKNLDQFGIQQEFENGNIDAAVTYPPYSLALEKKHPVHKIFDSKEMPMELVDVLSAPRNFAETHKKELRALLLAYEKTKKYVLTQKLDQISFMAEREGATKEEVLGALKNDIGLLTPAEQRKIFFQRGMLVTLCEQIVSSLKSISQVTRENLTNNIAMDILDD